MSTSPSVFSRIVAREIPATVVAEDDRLIAIEDIAPKAPVHVLVVPKTEQYATVAELAAGDPSLLADLVAMAQRVADERAGASSVSCSTPVRPPDRPCSTSTPTSSRATSRKAPLPVSSTAHPASSSDEPEVTVDLAVDGIAMVQLLGPQDRLLRTVERQYPTVRVLVRGNEVSLTGPERDVAHARVLVDELITMVRRGQDIGQADVATSARVIEDDRRPTDLFGTPIVQSRGKSVRPKTDGQRAYVDAIDENTITFGIGPAGTGKTYLAMAKAVQALQRREVNRIILTRPAVEAGEKLGFLPGTLTDKIDPYLRPLYDALNEMMDPELVPKLLASGTVEVAPLAYMRGRTLNDSFVVLDEAQNTTPEQMKMFLTRLGFGSKMVVTGDITQVDLPAQVSGLRLVTQILDQVDDIHFARLTSDDVVRHTLVGRIVDAYSRYDEERLAEQAGDRPGGRGTPYRGNPDGTNRSERRGRPPQDRQQSPYPTSARGGSR